MLAGNKLAMSSTNSYLDSVLTSVLLDAKIIERKEHVFFLYKYSLSRTGDISMKCLHLRCKMLYSIWLSNIGRGFNLVNVAIFTVFIV